MAAKYKVGEEVHYHLVKGDTYISKGVISEVINTRVDGAWGYMYKIEGTTSLWLKESDILLG